MKLVVLIPAFNEEESIADVIKQIPKRIPGVESVKILVVNDGSTDSTAEVSRKAGAAVVSHRSNKGVGAAFTTGVDAALERGADIIVNVDADGQFNPRDIPALVKPILDNRADMVTCSRFLDKNLEPDMPWVKKFGNGFFTRLVNFCTGQRFTDTQCGFRAYSREAALRLTLFGQFTYTQESFLDLVNKGLRVVEVPLRVRGERAYGKSKVVSNVFSYGLRALTIIVRSARDYQPLKFFGSAALFLISVGTIIGLALFIRLLLIHQVSPYMYAVYLALVFVIVGFLLLVLALIADMSDRQRRLNEEILYRLKKKQLEGG